MDHINGGSAVRLRSKLRRTRGFPDPPLGGGGFFIESYEPLLLMQCSSLMLRKANETFNLLTSEF